MIFDKGAKAVQGRKDSLQEMMLSYWITIAENMNFDSDFTPIKIKTKWIIDLNV